MSLFNIIENNNDDVGHSSIHKTNNSQTSNVQLFVSIHLPFRAYFHRDLNNFFQIKHVRMIREETPFG